MGGIALRCTNQSRPSIRGVPRRRIRTVEEISRPVNKMKKNANMDISRASGKRIGACHRELVTAEGKRATVRKLRKTFAAAALGVLLCVPGVARAQYRFVTIDVKDATRTAANGNSLFEIVGEFDDKTGTHGFVLNKGLFKKDVFTQIDVPSPVAVATILNGINVFGRLVGTYIDPTGTPHCFVADKAALAKHGAFKKLDPPEAARSQGGFINALGQVVGTYRDNNPKPPTDQIEKRRGFIWFKGVFTIFNVPHDHPLFGPWLWGSTTSDRLWGILWR